MPDSTATNAVSYTQRDTIVRRRPRRADRGDPALQSQNGCACNVARRQNAAIASKASLIFKEMTVKLPAKSGTDPLSGEESSDPRRLGNILRKARQDQNLTLRDVADRSGLSRAFVGQVEMGQVNGSVNSIAKIVQAVGMSLADLFDPRQSVTEGVVAADQRVRITYKHDKHYEELLSPSAEGKLFVLSSTIEPGVISNQRYRPVSEEECVFVTAGTLLFNIEGERFTLGPGDSLTYGGTRSYSWANYGADTVKAIWVITMANAPRC